MGTIVDTFKMVSYALCFLAIALYSAVQAENEDTYEAHMWPRLYSNGVCQPEYGVKYADFSRPWNSNNPVPRYAYKHVKNVGTWEECGKLCYNERGCIRWTFNFLPNNPHMKGCLLQNAEHKDRWSDCDKYCNFAVMT